MCLQEIGIGEGYPQYGGVARLFLAAFHGPGLNKKQASYLYYRFSACVNP